MPVVSDSVSATSDLPLSFDMTVAFPLSGQGRPPKGMPAKSNAVEFNTLPGCTSVNASPRQLPNEGASLKAEAAG